MRRRRRVKPHANHERWLVSYADFITLLFAFFVVLYASSQVDKKKVGMVALAIQVAFQQMGIFEPPATQVAIDANKPMPFNLTQAIENNERTAALGRVASHPQSDLGTGSENADPAKLQSELEAALSSEIRRKEIALHSEPEGLVISLREAGFFESGATQLKAASEDAFDRIASTLRRHDYRLRIEGHTDNVPIHSALFPSNWELSTSRATEIVRLLIVRDGYPPERLSAGGFAEYHPIASNRTLEGRELNRRVDIIVLSVTPQAVAQAAGEANAQAWTPAASQVQPAKPSPTVSPQP